MHWRRYLVPLLVLFLLGAWFFSSGGMAHAASVQTNMRPAPANVIPLIPDPGRGYQYTVRTGTGYSLDQMSANEGFGPGEIDANGSFNVSSSYSISVGISIDLINATVGFNVETSLTRGGDCYVDPPAGVEGWVQIYAVYYVVYFNIYWHNSVTGQNTYQGYGSGQRFSNFQCESQIASGGGT